MKIVYAIYLNIGSFRAPNKMSHGWCQLPLFQRAHNKSTTFTLLKMVNRKVEKK